MVDDSTVAAFTPYALQRVVAKRRLNSCPVNFVAPWTYGTIGNRKRAVAARAKESGYLSGIKAYIILVSAGMASIAAPGPGM